MSSVNLATDEPDIVSCDVQVVVDLVYFSMALVLNKTYKFPSLSEVSPLSNSGEVLEYVEGKNVLGIAIDVQVFVASLYSIIRESPFATVLCCVKE